MNLILTGGLGTTFDRFGKTARVTTPHHLFVFPFPQKRTNPLKKPIGTKKTLTGISVSGGILSLEQQVQTTK
ncbi:MAG: hypothetical protein LBU65_12950 [Planctomycetaceae bacterium]|jgi:hypothetical protein|nr:hypothetical protein [Planctomycetaceae bacterium]